MGPPVRVSDGRPVPARVRVVELATLIPDLRVADSFLARTRGLLGRKRLERGEGLLIRGTSSIHTHFMRFAIDVVFLHRDGRVLKLSRELRPWRFAGCRGASDVVELPAGTCDRVGIREGVRLSLEERRP
jgi:uncharacterized membrane protein (UPF0127 family)